VVCNCVELYGTVSYQAIIQHVSAKMRDVGGKILRGVVTLQILCTSIFGEDKERKAKGPFSTFQLVCKAVLDVHISRTLLRNAIINILC
jgi:hypothetical protein